MFLHFEPGAHGMQGKAHSVHKRITVKERTNFVCKSKADTTEDY